MSINIHALRTEGCLLQKQISNKITFQKIIPISLLTASDNIKAKYFLKKYISAKLIQNWINLSENWSGSYIFFFYRQHSTNLW